MSKLPILLVPDARLRQICRPVETIDAATERLLDDMLETMYAAPGIGLAAPQIGSLSRLIVIDVADKEEGETANPLKMINPEIVKASEDLSVCREGCLSIPEQYAEVTRPSAVTVRFKTPQGKIELLDADGLLATCIQHEIDHLNGVLFIDHISALKRNMLLKKLNKYKKDEGLA